MMRILVVVAAFALTGFIPGARASSFVSVCQRSPEIREAILRYLPASSAARAADCRRVTEQDLAQIENFGGTQFSFTGPSALKPTDLQGLRALQYLTLTAFREYQRATVSSAIPAVQIAEDFFADTGNLVSLTLRNVLADPTGNVHAGALELAPHAFHGLDRLKRLEIDAASVNFTAENLSPLRSVETLLLFELEKIPTELGDKVKDGTPVHFTAAELSSGIFAKLVSLKDLTATKNVLLSAEQLDKAFDPHFSFVKIDPGTFQMGSPASEAGHQSEEIQHNVTLTKPYEIQTTEVTQSLWNKVMKKNTSKWKGDDLPVEHVSFLEVTEFLEKLNQARAGQGYIYSLPTEAQWEFAARAKTTTAYYFGDNADHIDDFAWTNQNGGGTGHPVAKLKPNAIGLYDMLGGVSEFASDFYESYTAADRIDPEITTGSEHVVRGGSIGMDPKDVRCAARHTGYYTGYSSEYVGFRLVRMLKH